jgi:hypothetical protein
MRVPDRLRRAARPLAATALAVVLVTTLTAAAYTDRVYLNPDTLGQPDPFDVVLVVDGHVHNAPLGQPFDLAFDQATNVIRPGDTLSLSLRLANNHPTLAANFYLTVRAEVAAGGDIRPYMFTNIASIYDDGGYLPVGLNHTWDPATGYLTGGPFDLGALEPRGLPPLPEGAPWTPGNLRSAYTMKLLMTLNKDNPAVYQVPDGRLAITATFTARSVDP